MMKKRLVDKIEEKLIGIYRQPVDAAMSPDWRDRLMRDIRCMGMVPVGVENEEVLSPTLWFRFASVGALVGLVLVLYYAFGFAPGLEVASAKLVFNDPLSLLPVQTLF